MALGISAVTDNGAYLTVEICQGYANGVCGDVQNPDGSYTPPRRTDMYPLVPPAGVTLPAYLLQCVKESLILSHRLFGAKPAITPHPALVGHTIDDNGNIT